MASVTKEAIDSALEQGGTIDITTTGRESGLARRLEIVFHNIGGRIYHLTFHLKGRVRADLPATARIIGDEKERRQILPHIARTWGRRDLETMVRYSPLIEVTIQP
jgi:hypothetical protein